MIITIDPGIYMGFAIWKDVKRLQHPHVYGTIHYTDSEKRFHFFKKLLIKHNIKQAYIENSALMKKSSKGIVTAESGALVVLSQTIGRLVQIAKDHGIKTELISVAKWKGTLPKDVCERRIRRKLTRLELNSSSHAIDAIGIGLYLQGEF